MSQSSTGPWRALAAPAARVAVLLCVLPLAVIASESKPAVQDLVGARGSSIEAYLTGKGYERVGVTSPSSPEYWREPGSRKCVAVRTANGKVKSVEYASAKTCEKAAAYRPAPPPPAKGGFPTVCGVEVDGKTYRYRCTVDGSPAGGPGKTLLSFPDNRVAMEWLGGERVRVVFEGMVPQDTTFATKDGLTRFTAWDKPYFFFSDRTRAAAEVRALKAK